MQATLSADLSMLAWSVALCLVQMLVSVLAATAQVGLPALAGNREGMPPLTGLAGRAMRAHRNMLESLLPFAALVLAANVSGRAGDMTALGAQLFFWGRLAYAGVYLAGLPWVRTGVWALSMAGLVIIFLQLV